MKVATSNFSFIAKNAARKLRGYPSGSERYRQLVQNPAFPLNGARIGLLTASASRLGGGVFEAVAAHAVLLRDQGAVPAIFALEDEFSAQDRDRFPGCEVTVLPVKGPRQIGFAPGLVDALLAARLDTLHLHGIWMYPSAAGSIWAARTGKAYAISPHGMLDPWITGRGKLKKALARAGYERRSWARATAFHALTEREAADIARECGEDKSVVIANPAPPLAIKANRVRGPQVSFVGRIHPKKNLASLIAAWSALYARGALPEGARLTLAGWGDDAHVADLRASLSHAPGTIEYIGPIYGQAKADLLARSRFVALPSLSEGLPMAILEAWAAGAPTLMSSECNLPAGFATGAAIDCGMDEGTVAAALERALALDASGWRTMQDAALALAGGPFSGRDIALRWAGFYTALKSRSPAD
ncbi:glycosyltransferase [Croceicoccus ponticola]|uniref:Glycosyltransferase n=1 Tax=Croceicoccus ponticola TaxID=2217664 RepID=A0A437GY30_9SPHN|nr:glycosyltransferase [Croceicoccus ponticola]RVQ67594.1 glycosyltransferase [Croceicoccus ponticola]